MIDQIVYRSIVCKLDCINNLKCYHLLVYKRQVRKAREKSKIERIHLFQTEHARRHKKECFVVLHKSYD